MKVEDDDETYRRNVRTMGIVLAAIVITVFAAIFVPPLLNPLQEQFPSSVRVNSPYGFSLNLSLNTTQASAGKGVNFEVWLNNTSDQIVNVTSLNSWLTGWPVSRFCPGFPPANVGVVPGYYSADNVSLSQVLPVYPVSGSDCPELAAGTTARYILFQPFRSVALIVFSNSSEAYQTDLRFSYSSSGSYGSGRLSSFSSVMTVVAADEWGDIVVAHFLVGNG